MIFVKPLGSNGMALKSQYANEYCVISTGLCHFAHYESIRSYSKVKS